MFGLCNWIKVKIWSLTSVGSHSAAVKNWLSCNHKQAAEGCISGPSSPLDSSYEDIQWATACPSFTFSNTSETLALSTCSLHGLFSGPFRSLKWLDPFIPWQISDPGTTFWEQDFQQWHSLNGILKSTSAPCILGFGSKEVIGTVVAIKFLCSAGYCNAFGFLPSENATVAAGSLKWPAWSPRTWSPGCLSRCCQDKYVWGFNIRKSCASSKSWGYVLVSCEQHGSCNWLFSSLLRLLGSSASKLCPASLHLKNNIYCVFLWGHPTFIFLFMFPSVPQWFLLFL